MPETATKDTKIELTGNGYELAIGTGITERTTATGTDATAAGWTVNGTTATYHGAGMTAGYSLASDKKSIAYYEASASADGDLFTVSGLTADNVSELTADMVNGTTLTLTANFLPKTTTPLTLTNEEGKSYTLAIKDAETNRVFTDASDSKIKTAATFDAVENKTGEYTYTAAYTKDYYILKDNSVTFTAGDESTAKTSFTIRGLKDNLTVSDIGSKVTIKDKTVTLSKDAVATFTADTKNAIVLDGGVDYVNLALADDLTKKNLADADKGSFTEFSEGTATYTTNTYKNYFAANGTTAYDYVAQSGGAKLTISGLNSSITTGEGDDATSVALTKDNLNDYITVSETDGVINVNIDNKDLFAADTDIKFGVPTGYTLNVGGKVTQATADSGDTGSWIKVGSDTYAYSISNVSSYYRFNGTDTLSYVASTGNHRLVLKGLSSTPATDAVTFDESTHTATFNSPIEGDVGVVSNAGEYTFAFKTGVDFSGMTFTGSDGADTFDIAGASVNVNGGKGADTFNVSGSGSINGGEGDDTINVTGTDVTVTGGAGNDSLNFASGASGVISLSDGTDSVEYSNAYTVKFDGSYSASLNNNNVVFTSGSRELVVLNGKAQAINIQPADGDATTFMLSYDYESMLTYNDEDRKTAVTLNGADEEGKTEFTAPSLTAGNYAGTAVSITAGNTSNAVYIEGNANHNIINGNGNDNSIDGGAGNDRIYAGSGSETFIYKVGEGSDIIYNFDATKDKIYVSGATLTAENVNISGNDIIYTFTSGTGDSAVNGTLTLKNVFANATELNVNFVNDKGTTLGECAYTYQKGGAVVNGSSVYLTAGATTYAPKAGDTINNYKSTVSLTGLKLKDIATASVDTSKNVTLGVTNGNIAINGGDGSVNLNGTTYTVAENVLSNGNNHILTSGHGKTFTLSTTDSPATIDASFASGITLNGSGGADTFIVGKGKNVIRGYTAGSDVISVASTASLDFANFTSTSGNSTVTIGGSDGNELQVAFSDTNKKLSVVSGKTTQVYDFSVSDGTVDKETNPTAITLKSGSTGFDASTNTNYGSLVTIDASEVASAVAVTANTLDNYIVTGAKGMTLTGGDGNDTFAHGSGNDVISDYHYTEGEVDVVSISGGVNAITAISGSDSLTLTLGTNNSVQLAGVSSASTVNVNGKDYTFDTTANKISTADKLGVYFLKGGFSAADYTGAATVMANAGGTITASDSGLVMGGKGVTLEGANGADVYVYNGGDVSIGNYQSNDRISLASGYAISGDPTVESGSVKLTVTDGTNSGTLTINGITATTPVKVGSDSGEKILYFKSEGDNAGSFNNADPGKATAVTAGGGLGDYGALKDDAQTYGNLSSITASNNNAHLVGNSLANTFVLTGGESNILTGGIGKDTFIFGEGGGGIITDFGSGATKFGSGTALATAPTTDNRDKPNTYAEGNDILKVNGTVVEIAFNGHGVASTKNNAAFTAYVTYDADGDGTGDYTVMLGNIAKAPTKTGSSPVYKTDDVAAKTLKIWDTSSDGTTSKVLSSTALNKLFVTTSEYKTNITALNDIVTNSGGQVAVVDLYGTNPVKDFTKAFNGISYSHTSKQ